MAHSRIYWLHTLSPTHVGTGRGLGYIDLPIQREKLTNWPVIPGSAFKGVWSDKFRTSSDALLQQLATVAFGKAQKEESESVAGSLIPSDARLVALPIRSFSGTFAWCTSPMVLKMLHRDLALADQKDLPKPPGDLNCEVVHVTGSSLLVTKDQVFLEDLDFKRVVCQTADAWAQRIAEFVFPAEQDSQWRKAFQSRFAVVSDNVFDYLCTTGTEVVTRVRIDDETKTVVRGQLWTEEAVPAETIFCGTIMCDRAYGTNSVKPEELIEKFATEPCVLQIGGKASVGRGRVQVRFNAGRGA